MIGDTIAAVSTPRGRGGVALLRVSGPDAVAVSERVFFPKNRKKLSELLPRTATYGSICTTEPDGSSLTLDDGIATVFLAPASFTGEDTVEICCHGGILLTETVLAALLTAGARPAEAGEFTKRAFLNGKLGLSASEALADLLEAQSREQIILAHSGMKGRTEERTEAIYRRLCRVLASAYAVIDYPDEDLAEMSREEMLSELTDCAEDLSKLCSTYRTGHAVAEGVRTVICGKPNVGKSSFFNRLLGREAAIVTDIEGTTRDLLTSTAILGRVTLQLTDTAGIHEAGDRVEQIGIDRALRELEQAELVFALFDASAAPTEQDRALAERLRDVPATVIAVLNKKDLSSGELPAYYREYFKHCVLLSAESGEGFEELSDLVEALFLDGALDLGQDAVLANARQYAAAQTALGELDSACEVLRSELPTDICCSAIEGAMSRLSELDGRAVSEDLVAEIFSHFCVGK